MSPSKSTKPAAQKKLYEVLLDKKAQGDLDAIKNKKDFQRVSKILRDLATDPRPQGLIDRLPSDAYRTRKGNYRVIYFVDHKACVVIVSEIPRRNEATYKKHQKKG